ncbi:MAG: hypothetical protein ACR2RF_25065 [Geminicoccaceae bacterium]
MAVLTAEELTELRQGAANDSITLAWTKTNINAALQAIEDWWETTAKLDAATEIETAAPGVFSNPEKKLIGKWWMKKKFDLGG